MNILYVTWSPMPHVGGKSKVILSEAGAFATRHRVHLICARPGDDLGKEDSYKETQVELSCVDSERSPLLFRRLLAPIRMALAIRRLDKTYNVDVVSSHDVFGAMASILAGLRRTCLLTLHSTYSLDPFVMEERVTEQSLLRKVVLRIHFIIDSLIEVLCYNLVRGIICVSEYEQQDAMRKTICKAKILLIRNAIDTKQIPPQAEKRKELRAILNLPNDLVTFLFIGRMVPKNGPYTIIRAVPDAISSCKDSRFVFVGEGPEKKRCEEYARHAGVLDMVRFLGARNAMEIFPVADVFVSHVSSLVEGIGLTILEAMANGLAVIVGEDQITSKILECGEDVLCVKKDDPRALAEAMASLAKDSQRRRILSVAGRHRVIKDFSLKTRISKLEAVYSAVARQGAAS